MTSEFKPMSISGAGVCCSIGMNLAAADCALRAGIDQFQQGNFYDLQNEPLRISQLNGDTSQGVTRLAKWCALAIEESIHNAFLQSTVVPPEHSSIPLLLLAAERERPHSNDNRYKEIFDGIQQQLGHCFHEHSRIIPAGRAGIGLALQLAQQWLATGAIQHVIIAGADSYLDNYTINFYLGKERLRTSTNSDGFIPGEAAAAILLRLSETDDSQQLTIRGLGLATEQGSLEGTTPNRAQALSQAFTDAIAQAGIATAQYQSRFSDQNGESYFAREAAHALTRLGTSGLPKLETYTIADCVGEVGAATAPLMLAWASRLLTKQKKVAHASILHLANDDGLRTAITIATNIQHKDK